MSYFHSPKPQLLLLSPAGTAIMEKHTRCATKMRTNDQTKPHSEDKVVPGPDPAVMWTDVRDDQTGVRIIMTHVRVP